MTAQRVPSGEPAAHRRQRLLLLAGIAAGCGLVWTLAFDLTMGPDAREYHRYAQNLLQGRGFSDVEEAPFVPTMNREPVYPVFLAGVYAVFGPNPWAVRLVQVGLHALTILVLFLIGERLFGPQIAWVSSMIAAVIPGLVEQCLYLHTEVLYTALLAGMVWCALQAFASGRVRWYVATGLLLGLATLCRSATLVLVVVLVAAGLLIRPSASPETLGARIQRLALAVGIFTLVVSPWVIRNARLFDYPAIRKGAGLHLWLRAARLDHPEPEIWIGETYVYSRTLGRWLFPAFDSPTTAAQAMWGDFQRLVDQVPAVTDPARAAAVDRQLLEEAKRKIAEQPLRYLGHTPIDFLRVNAFGHLMVRGEGNRLRAPWSQAPWWHALSDGLRGLYRVAVFPVLFIVMVAGMAATVRQWRHGALLLVGTIVAFNVVHSMIYATFRLNLPLIPYYLMFATVAEARWRVLGRMGSRAIQGLDALLSAVGALVVAGGVVAAVLLARLRGRRSSTRQRRLIQLVNGSYEAERKRNALDILRETDYGYFDHVYHVHFYTRGSTEVRLSPKHTVIDFCVDRLEPMRSWGWKRLNLLLNTLAFLRWGCRLIRRERIAALHASDPYVTGLQAWALSRLTGVPYVAQVCRNYDLDYQALKRPHFRCFRWRWVEKAVERIVYRGAALGIADRKSYADYGLANGVRPGRMRLTRVICDRRYYDDPALRRNLKAELGLEGKKLLLYVGRLSDEKFSQDLLDALKAMLERHPDAVLVLAGDGPQRQALESAVRLERLEASVRLLGPVPMDALPDLLASADVVLGPHMGWTLIEAALAGRPIVAYDFEWHPEFIEHDKTGCLVPFRDAKQLARSVCRILEDEPLAHRLGSQARLKALQDHRPDDFHRDMRGFFHELLERNGQP